MAAEVLALDHLPGATRVAASQGAHLTDLYIDRRDLPDLTDAVVAAKVQRAVPALGGSFVSLGELGEAFLKRAQPAAGRHLAVQVRDPGRADKPPTMTAEIGLAGRFVVLQPGRSGTRLSSRLDSGQQSRFDRLALPALTGTGVTIRTAAGEAADAPVRAEAERLAAAWQAVPAADTAAPGTILVPAPTPLARALKDHPCPQAIEVPGWCRQAATELLEATAPELADRLTVADDPVGTAGWDEVIAAALEPEVPLDGGGSLAIEPTRALTAVDVDQGNRPGRRRGLALAACEALMAELRRRNLAGLIALDLPQLGKGDGEAVLNRLGELAAADPAGVTVQGFTRGGLLELTRQRRGRPLTDYYSAEAAPVAAAFAACRAVAAYRGQAPQLTLAAAPDVAAALEAGGPAAEALQIARRTSHTGLASHIDPSFASDGWRLA